MACDGLAQCDDATDEIDGCRIYQSDGDDFCLSWNGRKHVPCTNSTIKVGGGCLLLLLPVAVVAVAATVVFAIAAVVAVAAVMDVFFYCNLDVT